jgi:glutathione synthase/RimK-type ligase-like ATP-grasp enzyme
MGRSRHSVETMRVAIVAHRPSATNLALARRGWNGAQVELLSPREALLSLGHGDLVLGRLDVRDDLDGVEEGLWALERLLEAGVSVLNPPPAALCAHDKLLTARSLRRAGLPHPRTRLIERYDEPPDLDYPAVLKPRFGSWGRDVVLCRDRRELERSLDALSSRPWFRTGGALAQELIPPLGHDLRLIVAAGGVVGAAKRTAAARGVEDERRARRLDRARRPSARGGEARLRGSGCLGSRPRRRRPASHRAGRVLRHRAERGSRSSPGLLVRRPRRLR